MTDLDQHHLLQIRQITEELSSCERRTLLYLCGTLDTDTNVDKVRQTLKCNMERSGNPSMFLKELLLGLERFDILRKVFNISRSDVEQHFASFAPVLSSFRVLMVKLNEDIGVGDVEKIKFLASKQLSRDKLETVKSFLDVVIHLERLDLVSPEQVGFLENCLRDIGRIDLVKKLTAYRPSAGISDEFLIPPPSYRAATSVEQYSIKSNPRGVCVIIDCVGNDGAMLEQTFQDLYFKVYCFQWLGAEDIYITLRSISKKQEHQAADAFVCCIISRGASDRLLGTDLHGNGRAVDDIRRLYTAESCPLLAGKPKLFFIQMYSVAESASNSWVAYQGGTLERDSPVARCIPNDADILWSHCWTDEHQIEREQHHSVYLRALADAIRRGRTRF